MFLEIRKTRDADRTSSHQSHLRPAALLKKRLWQNTSLSINHFLENTSGWLLLRLLNIVVMENQQKIALVLYFESKYDLLSLFSRVKFKTHFPLKCLVFYWWYVRSSEERFILWFTENSLGIALGLIWSFQGNNFSKIVVVLEYTTVVFVLQHKSRKSIPHLKTTFCFLPLKKLPKIPLCFHLNRKPMCHTLYNGFEICKESCKTT